MKITKWEMIKTFAVGFFTSNKFKAFLWQTLNAFLVLLATQIAGVDWIYAAPIAALLNYITKYINQTYL